MSIVITDTNHEIKVSRILNKIPINWCIVYVDRECIYLLRQVDVRYKVQKRLQKDYDGNQRDSVWEG